jgi:hypothetical protein
MARAASSRRVIAMIGPTGRAGSPTESPSERDLDLTAIPGP